ncbi:unnamed protein product, partial [Scytosiphon promiscuus]
DEANRVEGTDASSPHFTPYFLLTYHYLRVGCGLCKRTAWVGDVGRHTTGATSLTEDIHVSSCPSPVTPGSCFTAVRVTWCIDAGRQAASRFQLANLVSIVIGVL